MSQDDDLSEWTFEVYKTEGGFIANLSGPGGMLAMDENGNAFEYVAKGERKIRISAGVTGVFGMGHTESEALSDCKENARKNS